MVECSFLIDLRDPFGISFPLKSPAKVVEEMYQLEKELGILDFCLTVGSAKLSEKDLVSYFKQLKKIKLSRWLWCLRIDGSVLSEKILREFKKAGCRGLHLSFAREISLDLLESIRVLKFHLTLSLEFENPEISVRRGLLAKKTGVEEVEFLSGKSEHSKAKLFFEELVNQVPGSLAQLLDVLKWKPMEFFSVWEKWKELRFPDLKIEKVFVFNTFRDFVRELPFIKDLQNPQFQTLQKKPLIFLGPSLSKEKAASLLDAEYRPPIRRGDLTRAIEEGYRVIGIVDGVFHHAFSVSLQEIRQAIERGAKLYGSSSMGALRAADAYSIGMIGVGKIYSWYHSEKIDSDEEVALCFDETTGVGITEPLVNIRAILENLTDTEFVSEALGETILKEAMQIPYWQRTREALLMKLQKLLPDEIYFKIRESFFQQTDLKGEDAIALLEQIKKTGMDAETSSTLSY
jgi:hypothetical protein